MSVTLAELSQEFPLALSKLVRQVLVARFLEKLPQLGVHYGKPLLLE